MTTQTHPHRNDQSDLGQEFQRRPEAIRSWTLHDAELAAIRTWKCGKVLKDTPETALRRGR